MASRTLCIKGEINFNRYFELCKIVNNYLKPRKTQKTVVKHNVLIYNIKILSVLNAVGKIIVSSNN